MRTKSTGILKLDLSSPCLVQIQAKIHPRKLNTLQTEGCNNPGALGINFTHLQRREETETTGVLVSAEISQTHTQAHSTHTHTHTVGVYVSG